MEEERAGELARLLAGLRREGRRQSGLAAGLVPPDAASAYRVAAMAAADLGWQTGGWKIAANSPEMQRALRSEAPIYGRVFAQFIRESPAVLRHDALLHPIAECEYAARLGADLPPRAEPYAVEEVAAAVAALHPALEVAECRFVHDVEFPALPAILADGSGSGWLVLGPAIPDWQARDLAGQEVRLAVDGQERRRGTAGAALDHPLVPLTWLANALARTGRGLRAGELVSTGTCTGMVLARAGEEHVADYGPFGQVRVRFAP